MLGYDLKLSDALTWTSNFLSQLISGEVVLLPKSTCSKALQVRNLSDPRLGKPVRLRFCRDSLADATLKSWQEVTSSLVPV